MESKHKLSITQWALEDRPREKMMEKGAAALSDAELLAILIGSGNTEESAVELMRRLLLSCDNNLNSLAKWEVCDYSRFKGMGHSFNLLSVNQVQELFHLCPANGNESIMFLHINRTHVFTSQVSFLI